MSLNTEHKMGDITQFIGNSSLKKALISILEREGDIPQAYLFYGPSGCGKSALANVFCEHFSGGDPLNIKVTNAADDRTLDSIRKIIEESSYGSIGNHYRIVVFEEAHQLLHASKQALLDFIENPPKHVMLIFTTTEPEKFLKGTALSRRFFKGKVTPVSEKEMSEYVESLNFKFSKKIVKLLIERAEGSVGNLLMLADTILDLPEKDATTILNQIFSIETPENITHICKALIYGKPWSEIVKVIQAVEGEGESLRYPIKNYLSKVVMSDSKDSEMVSEMLREFLPSFNSSGREGLINACYTCSLIHNDFK